jgi:hypothetical protein
MMAIMMPKATDFWSLNSRFLDLNAPSFGSSARPYLSLLEPGLARCRNVHVQRPMTARLHARKALPTRTMSHRSVNSSLLSLLRWPFQLLEECIIVHIIAAL